MAFLGLDVIIESPCLLTLTRHIPSSLCVFFDYTPAFYSIFLFSLQVIYKTFQITCPFEEFSANSTGAYLSLNVSSHGHEYSNGLVHEDDDSHCSPRMFTINSQVGS